MTCLRHCCPRRRRVETRTFNGNNFIPSNIEMIYPTTQTVAPDSAILFSQTNYNTGVSFSEQPSNLGVSIVSSGVYQISFSGVASVTENANISIAITLNEEPINSSVVSQYITSAGPQIVNTSIILKVIDPTVNIGVKNLNDVNFEITNAKLDIIRTGNF